MMEKGKLKVSNRLVGKIKIDKKELDIPKVYNLAPRDKYNGADCQFIREQGTVVKVFFMNSEEFPKHKKLVEQAAQKAKNKIKKAEQKRKAEEKQKQNRHLVEAFKTDSFDMASVFCPEDTMAVDLKNYEIDNFHLKLNKLARHHVNDRDYSKSTFLFFKAAKGREKGYQIKANFGDFDFKNMPDRNLNRAKDLIGAEELIQELILAPSWRLITGLGNASVYETSITLHHIYGFPYIPASAIKGVLRNFIINTYFDLTEEERERYNEKDWSMKKENKAEQNINFKKIFGTQDKKGKITFFDAFPTQPPTIEVDIMTPHYGDYYSKDNVAPTDTQTPVPIPFLTVAKTPFQFLLGSKEFNLKKKLWKFELNEKEGLTLCGWLQSALENHGIGAKTAVGYGYMKPSST